MSSHVTHLSSFFLSVWVKVGERINLSSGKRLLKQAVDIEK